MRDNKKTVIFILILILALGGLYVLLGGQKKAVEQPIETTAEATAAVTETEATEETVVQPKAPNFTVYDADGNEVHLSDFLGKPVVLNFWASWCGPCQREMPDFQKKYEELGEDIAFLMINLTDGSMETVDSARSLIAEKGYTFPVYFDTKGNASPVYGVTSIPCTFFIDKEGYAIAHATGAIDIELLQQGIDMLG